MPSPSSNSIGLHEIGRNATSRDSTVSSSTDANGSRWRKRSKDYEKDLRSHSQILHERITRYDLLPASQYSDMFTAVTTSLMRYVDRNDRYKLRYYTQMALEHIPFDVSHHLHHVRANLQFICQSQRNLKRPSAKQKSKDKTNANSDNLDAISHSQHSRQDIQTLASFLGLEIRMISSIANEEHIPFVPEDNLEKDPIYIAYNEAIKQYLSVVKSYS
ncbi:hypothetical protein ACOME3_008907 [Neoechinorhynchus agilis]